MTRFQLLERRVKRETGMLGHGFREQQKRGFRCQRWPGGDGSVARKELGDWNMKGWIDSIVECLRAVKADDASLKIQNEFYEKSKHPLDTRP